MKRNCLFGVLVLALGVASATNAVASGPAAVAEEISSRVDLVQFGEDFRIGEANLMSSVVLPRFYAERGFAPAWVDPRNAEILVAAIRDSHDEGLNPEDYHVGEIERRRAELADGATPDPSTVAELDLLLTDALVALAYHYLYGKIDPISVNANWNVDRSFIDVEPIVAIESALRNGTLAADIENTKPKHYFYVRLRDALARYRQIEKDGGWETVPPGPALKPGDTDPRVPAIRRRLRLTGDLAAKADTGSERLDEALDTAVKTFQWRHGLAVDGVVGATTLETMNLPVARRIEQIRINMERARWYTREVERDAVVVNIAGFMVYVTRDDRVVWYTKAMVGKLYRKTPLFKGKMTHIVINPTWTVPPTILRKDVLPKVIADPAYLQTKNISVLDRSGKRLDPSAVDWATVSTRSFPYMLRQNPGPKNALGRVKFIFPNPHFVFLHDTPSRSRFVEETRTFSSGCVRVENPLELAALLLDDPENWSLEKIEQTVESGKTKTVLFEEPIAVYLAYWTAAVDGQGDINFRRDPYGRDPAVLEGLETRFDFADSVQQRYDESR